MAASRPPAERFPQSQQFFLDASAKAVVDWVEDWMGGRNRQSHPGPKGVLSAGPVWIREPETLVAGRRFGRWEIGMHASLTYCEANEEGRDVVALPDDVLCVAVIPLSAGRCEVQLGWSFPDYLKGLVSDLWYSMA